MAELKRLFNLRCALGARFETFVDVRDVMGIILVYPYFRPRINLHARMSPVKKVADFKFLDSLILGILPQESIFPNLLECFFCNG